MAWQPGSRFSTVTTNNHQAGLWITSILSLIYSFLALAARLAVKWNLAGLDDMVLGLAHTLAVAHWATIYSALSIGLGTSATSNASYFEAAKLVFASRILLLMTLSLSQCSVVLFLRRLFPRDNRKAWRLCNAALALMIPWGPISAFAVSIGCSPVKTLAGDESAYCSHNAARWKTVTAFSVAFECALVALPAYLFARIHATLKRRVLVITAFAFRLLTAALLITYLLSYLHFLRRNPPNIGLVPALAWQEVLMGFSLISASIPCLKGFMGRFDTGDLSRVQNNSAVSASRNEGFELRSMKSTIPTSAHLRLHPGALSNSVKIDRSSPAREDASIASEGSEQMIIRRKVEWNVETETAA